MDYHPIDNLEELNGLLQEKQMALVYFSHQNCNVCKVLKPKVAELIQNNFSQIALYYVNTIEKPEVSGQFSVFTVPTVLVFVDGKEYIRESRHISLDVFSEKINKLYKLYFE